MMISSSCGGSSLAVFLPVLQLGIEARLSAASCSSSFALTHSRLHVVLHFHLTVSCSVNCPVESQNCGFVWAEKGELSCRKVIWSPRGVESLPCPSGLCECLSSCLQTSCDPVIACHLSCLLPSHLCICHLPPCPYGEMLLNHRAVTHLPFLSATTGSHSKCWRGLYVHRACCTV